MRASHYPVYIFAGILTFCAVIFLTGAAFAQVAVNCGSSSLQEAIDEAGAFTTIQIAGTCNESVVIPEEKSNLTLDGGGTATIVGSSNSPSLRIRGRSITVRRLTVTGGTVGIEVSNGGDALIDGCTIQNASRDGIQIIGNSFVHLGNATVQNNGNHGVLFNENSSGRIGFFNLGDSTTSPNTIQGNVGDGIHLTGSSNARILGNTIRNNGDDGIDIGRVSHAHVSGNFIDGNLGHGIELSENSGVNLGFDSGFSIQDPPNATTVNNSGFGISCFINSSANGRIGTLAGTSGAKSFAAGCVDSLL